MLLSDNIAISWVAIVPVLVTLGEIGGWLSKGKGGPGWMGRGIGNLFGALFGAPDLMKAPKPPAPIDNSKAYFEELAKASIQRRLREGGGSAAAFKGQRTPSGGTSLW